MGNLDSRAWKDAYEDYKKSKHFSENRLKIKDWKAMVLGKTQTSKPKRRRPKNKKHKAVSEKVVPKRKWLDIHREYLRWRKTPEFTEWSRKQFLKQGGTCYYCDELLIGIKQNVDHVVPKIRGGDNHPSNLVLACWRCNKEKYTDQLSKHQRRQLKNKNQTKKGTYLENKYSQIELAYNLRQMFRDEL